MSMEVTCKYLRTSPRKVRPVTDLVRGKKAQAAVDILTFSKRGAAKPLLKLLKSALANVAQKGGVDVDNLVVDHVSVGYAPTLKRWRARSRGMANKILKRSTHIRMILEEK